MSLQSRTKPDSAHPRKNPLHVAMVSALLFGNAMVDADTFTVTSTADTGPGSLREAVDLTNQNSGPDTIRFIDGLEAITLTSGELQVTGEGLTLQGRGNMQIISADNNSRILSAFDGPVTLINVHLRDGRTETSDPINTSGCGGELNNGGAICVEGRLELQNSIVSDSATMGDNAQGGGIFAGGVFLRNSVITRNTTYGDNARGGGFEASGVTIVDSVVADNSTYGNSSHGGGFSGRGGNFLSPPDFSTLIVNSIIRDNTTYGRSQGAGFSGNGSGIYSSTISGNEIKADISGGAGANVAGDSIIRNSTITGNMANGERNDATAGVEAGLSDLKIFNSTISGNATTAGVGGVGISDYQTLEIYSSVLSSNEGTKGNFGVGNRFASGYVYLDAEMSVFGDDSTEVTGGGGNNVFTNDPGLAELGNNGCTVMAGATGMTECVKTHQPLPGSPTIDAGSNPRGLVNDQRGPGYSRVRGSAPDIGAVESGGLAASPSRLDFIVPDIGAESAPRRVTVTNTGFVPREVTSLDAIREPFLRKGGTCQTPPFGLEPGDSCTIEISFSPTVIATSVISDLYIADDPASDPAANVTLSGNLDATNTIVVDSSADDGHGSLRDAVGRANDRPGTDRIVFARGLSDIILSSGQIEVTERLILQGGEENQRISANDASRILAVTDEDATLSLENITFANGFTTAAGAFPPTCQPEDGRGGALCSLGEVSMLHSVIRDSGTTGESATGGGAFLTGVNVLRNSVITNNFTRGDSAQGGGVFVDPPNFDSSGAGASLFAYDTIISNNLTEGIISAGGGAFSNGFATLYNSSVSANRTTGRFGNGAGLYARGALVNRSAIIDNHASGLSPTAGGLGVSDDAIIQNSVISGNSSALVGGGAYVFDSDLRLLNNTITNNSAPEGGGVALSNETENSTSKIQITDSVIAANTGESGANLLLNRSELGSTELSMAYSVFGGAETVITGENVGNRFTDSPMLQTLADNGCAQAAGTGTYTSCVMGHAVLAGSPVIDAASNRRRFAWDQRGSGHRRDAANAPDIGAFETSGPSVSPEESDFGFIPVGDASMPIAITLRNNSPAAIRIDQIDAVQPPFEIVASSCPAIPFDLEPGESCVRDYRFVPADGLSASQQLTIQVDGTPAATVQLSGNRPRPERLIVSTASNDGLGSLRNAVRLGNAMPGRDIIEIAPGLPPIELTTGQITVLEPLEIRGPTIPQIVTAGRRSRMLAALRADAHLTVSGLVLEKGQTTGSGFSSGPPTTITDAFCTPISGSGGAVCARGNLIIRDVQLIDNSTAGNHARGGGAFVAGNFLMQTSRVSQNSTFGRFADGAGVLAVNDVVVTASYIESNATYGYSAGGGGFRAFGHAEISSSTISQNSQVYAPPQPIIPRFFRPRGGGFSAASASIADSVITGNSTYDRGAPGGGFFSAGAVEISSSTISGNTTSESDGGGFSSFGDVEVSSSKISGNVTVGNGGGFRANNLIIKDSIVEENIASSSGGGFSSQSLVMNNSIISENHADGSGGGFTSGSGDIRNSTISNNSASSRGGGAHIFDNSESRTIISNSTFSDNQAQRTGGALYVRVGELEMLNTTVTGNSANVGGGIHFSYNNNDSVEVTLRSSIVSGNTAACLDSASNFGSLSDLDECIRGEPFERTNITLNSEYSIFGDPADEIDGVSTANIFTDQPALGLLESNSCTRQAGLPESAECVPTHLPAPASPARDAGSNPEALLADQRGPGFSRTIGAQTDIGSIETGNTFVISPDPLEFERLRAGEPSSGKSLRLENFGSGSLPVEGLSGLSSPFELFGGDCDPFPFPLASGESCSLTIRFEPGMPGDFAQSVEFDGNFPMGTDRQVQISGSAVASALESTPEMIDFGAVPVGFVSGIRVIDLRNSGSLDLEVATIAVDDDRFQRVVADCGSVPFTLGPDRSCQIAYVFLSSQPGSASATVEIVSDADIDDQAEVLLTAETESLLALQIMPSILRFGDWPLGQLSDSQMAIVENVGLAAVDLGTVGIAGSASEDFLISTDTCSSVNLEVNEFCGIDVQFQPSMPGIRQADLVVESNLESSPGTVMLEGTNDVVFTDGFEPSGDR